MNYCKECVNKNTTKCETSITHTMSEPTNFEKETQNLKIHIFNEVVEEGKEVRNRLQEARCLGHIEEEDLIMMQLAYNNGQMDIIRRFF